MDNLFYNLPEDIQLNIINMNPHPVAEIMKTFYKDVEDDLDDCRLAFFIGKDCGTKQLYRRVFDNICGNHTVEIYKIVKNKYYIFFDTGDLYTIREGKKIWYDEPPYLNSSEEEYLLNIWQYWLNGYYSIDEGNRIWIEE